MQKNGNDAVLTPHMWLLSLSASPSHLSTQYLTPISAETIRWMTLPVIKDDLFEYTCHARHELYARLQKINGLHSIIDHGK